MSIYISHYISQFLSLWIHIVWSTLIVFNFFYKIKFFTTKIIEILEETNNKLVIFMLIWNNSTSYSKLKMLEYILKSIYKRSSLMTFKLEYAYQLKMSNNPDLLGSIRIKSVIWIIDDLVRNQE